MTQTLSQQDILHFLERTQQLIVDNTERLCELDSVVGDGDHGSTIARGMKAGWAKVHDEPGENINESFKFFADEMMEVMGGASGPLFGSFFRGLAVGAKGVKVIDTDTLKKMFDKGLGKVKKLGKAEMGDKTFVDALEPAVIALTQAHDEGKAINELLSLAYQKAIEGAEATKEMTAGKGRARYAGDNSLGHIDAGAVSMTLILQAFSETANKEQSQS